MHYFKNIYIRRAEESSRIEIKLTSLELNNTNYVIIYVNDSALTKINLKCLNDLSRDIWHYKNVINLWNDILNC